VKPSRRHRELRKPFVTAIVITDAASERQISSHTSDLSIHGCFVPTPTPYDPGVNARITIVHAGAKVVAFGHVIHSRADGMGIAFTKIEPSDQAVLERWMTDLRAN
jgi:hypothetical protein